jgi:hypothetical protein
MTPFVAVVAVLPLVAFYAWMFRDMTRNPYLTPEERTRWLWFFVLFNVFGAAVYYAAEYRNRG